MEIEKAVLGESSDGKAEEIVDGPIKAECLYKTDDLYITQKPKIRLQMRLAKNSHIQVLNLSMLMILWLTQLLLPKERKESHTDKQL